MFSVQIFFFLKIGYVNYFKISLLLWVATWFQNKRCSIHFIERYHTVWHQVTEIPRSSTNKPEKGNFGKDFYYTNGQHRTWFDIESCIQDMKEKQVSRIGAMRKKASLGAKRFFSDSNTDSHWYDARDAIYGITQNVTVYWKEQNI